MKNKLLLLMALALAITGCKTFAPRPETPAECSTAPGPAPKPPPIQKIDDAGALPIIPPSTDIVVGYCPATSGYTAMGVDTRTQRFTFLVKGDRSTQPQAFRNFYAAGARVTVYTQRVKVTASTGSTSRSAAEAPPPSPSPTAVPQPAQEPPEDPYYDPCQTIGEEPPPIPKPTGSTVEPWNQFTNFQNLSWNTAYGLNNVSELAPTVPGTAPVPQ